MLEYLQEQKDQASCIPERHGFSETAGEEADSFCTRRKIEFLEDRIDEDGDGKFGADQQTHAQSRQYVESVHTQETPEHLMVSQEFVLTNMSGGRHGRI
jgi:hypothetical protein